MSKVKRIVTLILAMLMLASVNIPVYAATKPSVNITKVSAKTIKRGKKLKVTTYLNSGSYTMKSGRYRAFAVVNVKYKSTTGTDVAYCDTLYSGRGYHGYNWTVPKTLKTGKYYWMIWAGYHKKGAKNYTSARNNFNNWKWSDVDYVKITIK